MKLFSRENILRATRLTIVGKLNEATALIQRTLGGAETNPEQSQHFFTGPLIEGEAEPVHRIWPDQTVRQQDVRLPDPENGQFHVAMFSNEAGRRPYRLYVPSGYHGQAVPLVVMLHGCTQSPEDFATGTRMNEAAETRMFLVAYPEQTKAANATKCWNWFNAADQRRDHGEPSLIAGITRAVMADYAVDPARVFVAGLSAGGAAAAIMGIVYPELYAAIGVHSGVACGAARDMVSAFATMRNGHKGIDLGGATVPPAIIFHGDQDSTVNARNGDALVAQLTPSGRLRAERIEGQAHGGGHAYSLTRHIDPAGRVALEQWVIHGAGHAWFGGSPAGSFTDPKGPDATAEMLRFFSAHPRS
ncbi:MAG: PHB depolymerase family esterase [Acidiphilium sp.]|nr:PHB depolymerase family esterase [Acidiphilium sp.]MDD4936477.1 PHB depolymerase family esterase [Acidiphilium sp.]